MRVHKFKVRFTQAGKVTAFAVACYSYALTFRPSHHRQDTGDVFEILDGDSVVFAQVGA